MTMHSKPSVLITTHVVSVSFIINISELRSFRSQTTSQSIFFLRSFTSANTANRRLRIKAGCPLTLSEISLIDASARMKSVAKRNLEITICVMSLRPKKIEKTCAKADLLDNFLVLHRDIVITLPRSFVRMSVQPSICPFVRSSLGPSVRPFIQAHSVHPSLDLFVLLQSLINEIWSLHFGTTNQFDTFCSATTWSAFSK